MKRSTIRCASSFFALSMCLISIAHTACGDDDGNDAGATGGGGDGAGATGGGGDDAGATGGGGDGAGATGGGGSGGGPDQPCDHESPDGGSEGPVCGPGELRIAGDVDGNHVDETLMPGWGMAAGHTFLELGKFGLLYFPYVHGQPGETTAGRGLIRFPDESSLADSWYCAGYGSELSVGPSFVPFTATLDSLSSLGSCESGTPVSGVVESCLDALDCDNPWSSVSTIEGASFEVEIAGGYTEHSTISGDGNVALVFDHPTSTADFSGSGFFRIESHDLDDSEPNVAKTAPVARAFFVVPLGAPDAGAVYCAGDESNIEYQFDDQGMLVVARSTFKNLKRIGACPAENACLPGQLQICDEG